MLNKKANLTLRLTGVPIIWSYTFPAMLMIVKIFKKYESVANLQMTVITKIQIFSETIFLVISPYGNACNAYREGRNANVLITLLGTVYLHMATYVAQQARYWISTHPIKSPIGPYLIIFRHLPSNDPSMVNLPQIHKLLYC